MGTLAELKARVLDEVGNGVSVRQIGQHIARAIERHAGNRFWFNVRTAISSTVAGDPYVIPPEGFRQEDAVFLDAGGFYQLERRTLAQIEALAGVSLAGSPFCYAREGGQVRLYPTPNAVWEVTFTGLFDETAPVSDASANAWTGEAADLIAAGARKTLYRDILKDAGGAVAAQGAEDEALWRLRCETTARLNAGILKPSF